MVRLLVLFISIIVHQNLFAQLLKPSLMEWHSRFNILSVKFSNDGNYLLSLGDDNAVLISDLKKRVSVIKTEGVGELLLETHPDKPIFFSANKNNDTISIEQRSIPFGNLLGKTSIPAVINRDWYFSRPNFIEMSFYAGNPVFLLPYDSSGVRMVAMFDEEGNLEREVKLPSQDFINAVKPYGDELFISTGKAVFMTEGSMVNPVSGFESPNETIGNIQVKGGSLVVLTDERVGWYNLETKKISSTAIRGFFAKSIGDRTAGLMEFRHPFVVDENLSVWLASKKLFFLGNDVSLKPYGMAKIDVGGKIAYPFTAKNETAAEKVKVEPILALHERSNMLAMVVEDEILLTDLKEGPQFSLNRKNLPIRSFYFTATPGKILLQVDDMKSPGFMINLSNGRMETIGVMDDIYYTRNKPGKELLQQEAVEWLWWPSHKNFKRADYYVYRNDPYLRYPFKDAYFPELPGNQMLVMGNNGELQLKDLQGKLMKKVQLYGLGRGQSAGNYIDGNKFVPDEAKKTGFSEYHILQSSFYDSLSNLLVVQIIQNSNNYELTTLVIDLLQFKILQSYYGDGYFIHPSSNMLITDKGLFSLKDHSVISRFPNETIGAQAFTLSRDRRYLYFFTNGYEAGDKLFAFDLEQKALKFIGRQQGMNAIVCDPHSSNVYTKGLENTIMIWDGPKGNLLATLAVSGIKNFNELRQSDGSYLVIQPDGNYMGDHKYFRMLKLNDGKKSYSISDVDAIFHRPDIVLETLGYTSAQALGTVSQQALQRMQRVNIQSGDNDIAISNAQSVPYYSGNGTVGLQASLPADVSPYKGYMVYVNGTAIWQQSKLFNNDSLRVEIDLVDAINHVRLCLVRKDGKETPGDYLFVNSKQAESGTLYLVGLGVNEYKDSAFNLKYAAKDMNDLLDFLSLSDSYKEVKMARFTNKQVSQKITDSIRHFLQNAKSGDVVLCYYAGHGMLDALNEYYLGTYDIDFGNPSVRGIKIGALNEAVSLSPARKKMIFLDACHSGLVDDLGTATDSMGNTTMEGVVPRGIGVNKAQKASAVEFSFNHFNQGTGVDIVAAAAGNEFALEMGNIKNGVFTYSLLKALKGGEVDFNKDGVLSLTELHLFVSDQTKKMTKGAQRPTFRQNNLYQDIGLINASDTYLSRFMDAASSDHVQTLTLLLDNREVGINQKNKDGFTALTYAAREGSFNAVKLLIERGADMHLRTDFGTAPLYLAAWNNHYRIAYFLLNKGASKQEDLSEWHLKGIMEKNDSKVLMVLNQFPEVQQRQLQLRALAEALFAANLSRADSLSASSKFDINEHLLIEGLPLIAAAVLSNKEAAVSWVLNRGADVNNPALDNLFTPLMYAASLGNVEVVQLLLNKGADKNLKDTFGNKALDHAIMKGHKEVENILK